jgi:long-chain acyl-CoA synthetase
MFSYIKNFISRKKDSELDFFNAIKKQYSDENGNLLHVSQILRITSIKFPENIAITYQNESISYKELYIKTILLSKTLINNYLIKPNDRIVIFSENSLSFYIIYLAVWAAKATVNPVNIFLHQKELAHIINDSQPSLIFTSHKLKNKIENVLNSPECIYSIPIVTPDIIKEKVDTKLFSFLLKENHVTESQDINTMCLLLYTSGTTGFPKGVMLSSKNILTNTIQSYARFKVMGKLCIEKFFCVLPLFHLFAQNVCLWLPIITGSSIIVVPKIDRALIRQAFKDKPTLFFGFPALYGLLCIMKNLDLDSVKIFISGSDMLPDKIRSAFGLIYGRKIYSGYGLTEASPVVSLNNSDTEEASHVVGKPLIGISCEIRNNKNQRLPRESTGILWIRGENIMIGYYKEPKLTKTMIKDGWLNTGDFAFINSEGTIAITGRSKDIIIHKGLNIYPQEIENVLLKHPSVFKAAVIGKREVISGEIPIAYLAINTTDKTNNLEKSLKNLCTENLAPYKVPRKFIYVENLVVNGSGKIDKNKLVNLQ